MEFVCIWGCFGIACAMVASSKGLSVPLWFFLGVLLGPFGLLFALVQKKNLANVESEALAKRESKKCPYCAELIKLEAIKCRFCGSEIPDPVKYPI